MQQVVVVLRRWVTSGRGWLRMNRRGRLLLLLLFRIIIVIVIVVFVAEQDFGGRMVGGRGCGRSFGRRVEDDSRGILFNWLLVVHLLAFGVLRVVVAVWLLLLIGRLGLEG